MFREPFPILHVSDPQRSVDVYTEAFGFEVGFRWPEEGPLEFAFLKLGETGIGIGRSTAPDLPDWPGGRDLGSFQLCIYADDTDAAAERGGSRATVDAVGREARVLRGSGREPHPRDRDLDRPTRRLLES
jgi:catechol 2,3-dioxygenase-like lactoylglutathione lyase family enzyme